MYSVKRNIQQLVSLMLKRGINDVVVCPGSRNAPLVHTFAEAGMRCYEITDERSAGFFAIGLIEAKECAVAVCCTSGSAVLNLAPAVSEAYYRPLPLLVITADRPACWIGQMDGQTLPQTSAYGSMVRKVVSLPESSYDGDNALNADNVWHSNRLINEALIEQERTNGPVQINVPITEPLFDFTATELPDERVIEYCGVRSSLASSAVLSEDMVEQWDASARRLIIVGQMLPGRARELEKILCGLRNTCVILAEQLSNIHDGIVENFDEIIKTYSDNPLIQPDMVVTLGGHFVSKSLKQWLRKNPPRQHWHISETGEMADVFCCATHIIEARAEQVLLQLAKETSMERTSNFVARWNDLSESLNKGVKVLETLDEMAVLRAVTSSVTAEWNIHVANSCMVRNLQRLSLPPCDVHCNRGVNGIEGSLSAAVGYAVGSGMKTLLLIGDLSFFYDQNGLWNRFVREGDICLRILLINNGGGKIFDKLPGLETSRHRDTLIGGAHKTMAEGVALANNCAYRRVEEYADLSDAVAWLMQDDSNDVRILETNILCKENGKR